MCCVKRNCCAGADEGALWDSFCRKMREAEKRKIAEVLEAMEKSRLAKVHGRKTMDSIVIFGAGNGGKIVKWMLEDFGVPIKAFTDNNRDKWGTDCKP